MILNKIDSVRGKNNLIILILYCGNKQYFIISVINIFIDLTLLVPLLR